MTDQKTAIVFGGTSGLGHAIATGLQNQGYKTLVTGRKSPGLKPIKTKRHLLDTTNWEKGFWEIHLEQELTTTHIKCLEEMPRINLIVYAAGFYQEGTLAQLSIQQITEMVLLGLTNPAIILREIAQNQQNEPVNVIAVTSTSQWTPRPKEPVYAAIKSSFAQLMRSLAEDEGFGKILIAAPSGMKSAFWENTTKNTDDMLDPYIVARDILKAYNEIKSFGEYAYLGGKEYRVVPLPRFGPF